MEDKPIVCVIVGMAGTGKTALMQRIAAHVRQFKIASYLLNLDPAVSFVPYEPNIDIRDTVHYRKVMSEYRLGPNGAILTSLNLFATKFHQVLELLEKRAPEVDYIFIDTPGQIEAFTWSASGQIITETLAATFPTVLIYVMDAERCKDPTTFMSNMTYACSILYKTQLPFLIAFNKIDVTPHLYALKWMQDVDAFDDAVAKQRRRQKPKPTKPKRPLKSKTTATTASTTKKKTSASVSADTTTALSSDPSVISDLSAKTVPLVAASHAVADAMADASSAGVFEGLDDPFFDERKTEDVEMHSRSRESAEGSEEAEVGDDVVEYEYGELTYMDSLVKSLGIVLCEFYENIRTVGVSARMGLGMDDLLREIGECKAEYVAEYWPMIEKRMAEIKRKDELLMSRTTAPPLSGEARVEQMTKKKLQDSRKEAAISSTATGKLKANPFASTATAMWAHSHRSESEVTTKMDSAVSAEVTSSKRPKAETLMSESERFDLLSDYELMKLIHDEEHEATERKDDVEVFGAAVGIERIRLDETSRQVSDGELAVDTVMEEEKHTIS